MAKPKRWLDRAAQEKLNSVVGKVKSPDWTGGGAAEEKLQLSVRLSLTALCGGGAAEVTNFDGAHCKDSHQAANDGFMLS